MRLQVEDAIFAAEVIQAFLKMGGCPYGYDRTDLREFADRLASVGRFPQPAKAEDVDPRVDGSSHAPTPGSTAPTTNGDAPT